MDRQSVGGSGTARAAGIFLKENISSKKKRKKERGDLLLDKKTEEIGLADSDRLGIRT